MASPLHDEAAVASSSRDVLGTGLSIVQYATLVLASVGLFALWDGPLWTRPAGASHVMRFAVSYLAVIPLAAIVLLWVGRLTARHALTTIGTAWAVKLIVTSAMYTALAGGNAAQLSATTTTEAVPQPVAAGYVPASEAFASGVWRGPAPAGAIVAVVVAPAPGTPLPDPREHVLTISDGHYDDSIYIVAAHDDVVVHNTDSRLYTAHLYGDDGSPANQPVPPGGRIALPELDSGFYRVRSDGAAAATWLLVADHPYVARATDGSFSIANLPVGRHSVDVISVDGDQSSRMTREVEVRATQQETTRRP